MDLKATQKLYMQLEQQVEKAKELHQPIENLVQKQIKLLEETHDNFVSETLKNNKELENSIDFAGMRIKQLQAIASLCKKIGLSTEKYDKQIREIRIKTFGVDFVYNKQKSNDERVKSVLTYSLSLSQRDIGEAHADLLALVNAGVLVARAVGRQAAADV
jgi:hypothetical protein